MIGISEDGLYKLWGKLIYNFRWESNESALTCLREQEVILSRPTWWEWTQLEEWGYSDDPGTGDSRNDQAKQIEYLHFERMDLSDP
jgi:hypothetical protein